MEGILELKTYNKPIILLLIVLVAAVVTSVTATYNKSQDKSSIRNQQDDDRGQWPIADSSAILPADPKEKDKRVKRNKRHKFVADFVGPESENVLFYHWPPGFPAIPAAQSDVIVIGRVSEANAYLSDDRNGVYSEVILSVDQILKDNLSHPLTGGDTVIAERNGGRVRFPSGKIGGLYYTGLGMPRTGRKYILFLKWQDQEHYYHLITGYELRAGKVVPIDKTTSSDTNFDAYINTSEDSFLKEVQGAIATSSQIQPQ